MVSISYNFKMKLNWNNKKNNIDEILVDQSMFTLEIKDAIKKKLSQPWSNLFFMES